MTQWKVRRLGAALGAAGFLFGAAPTAGGEKPTTQGGALVYKDHCETCHSAIGDGRAPGVASLMYMSPRSIVDALESGRMKTVGDRLDKERRRAVAEWITRTPLVETPMPESAWCASKPSAPSSGPIHWSGWGGDIASSGFRDVRQSGITAETVEKLTLRWVFAFPEATQARSQPALSDRLLIVGSQWGDVYALDRETGCIRWSFAAGSAIRGAISIADDREGRRVVHFADYLAAVYTLDASDGTLIWKTKVGRHKDAVVTGSVAAHDGRVYVPLSSMEVASAIDPIYPCCKTSGAVVALDAQDGHELWYHRVIPEPAKQVGSTARGTAIHAPAGAPVWSSPTIDAKRGLLYIGTGENYSRPASKQSDAIQALDLATGELSWSFQGTSDDAFNASCRATAEKANCPTPEGPDFDFGMAPILVRDTAHDRDVLVVGQKSGVVFGLNPDRNGALLWSTRVGSGTALGGIHWGIASDGQRAYVTNSDHPRSPLEAGSKERGRTPGLYAVDLATGELSWSSPTPADVCGDTPGCFRGHSAAPTAAGGLVFAGSLDGRLRAHDSGTGLVLWEFDTTRKFDGVNGIPGHGGSVDGPGPVVSEGWLFVNSGYGLFTQMPGNVLMAFEVTEDE